MRHKYVLPPLSCLTFFFKSKFIKFNQIYRKIYLIQNKHIIKIYLMLNLIKLIWCYKCYYCFLKVLTKKKVKRLIM